MAADVELCLSAISDGEIKKLEFNKTAPVAPLQAIGCYIINLEILKISKVDERQKCKYDSSK